MELIKLRDSDIKEFKKQWRFMTINNSEYSNIAMLYIYIKLVYN